MIYRPQFAYPTPDGFRDQDFEHFFNGSIFPALAPTPGFPNPIYDIPLTIDPDAAFLWRGIKFDISVLANYGVRFRDCHLNYLSDDFVPWWLAFVQPAVNLLSGGQAVTHEPEIICPPTGVIMLDIVSYDTVPWTSGGPLSVSLCGVKRYDLSKCGCDGQ